MNFIEKIRKNKITQPIHREFQISDWHDAWNKEKDKSSKNEDVYRAGEILFHLMHETRIALELLHTRAPCISHEKLIMAYFSVSNRDRYILSKIHKDPALSRTNIFSTLLNNNTLGNNLTLDDVANGCVDGIQKAVFFRINQKKDRLPSIDPLPTIEFILKEIYLSQLYDAYESYWQAILWGDYSFKEINKKEKTYLISQDMSDLEISGISSQIRKDRLHAQTHLLSMQPSMVAYCASDKYLAAKEKSIPSLVVQNISSADHSIKTINTNWRVQEAYLIDEFSNKILNSDHGVGFSLTEALNIFRVLMLLSQQLNYKYPTEDEFNDTKKLLSFCPKFKRTELIKILEKATEYEFSKIAKIMDFLLFNGDRKKDLWCHPIIAVTPTSYIFLTSALISPIVKRLVEHWISTIGIKPDEKGTVFESSTLEELNYAINRNELITDFDPAVSKRIKLESTHEEEIDLLFRVGSTIVVGEDKSVFTTDSPISSYRALNRLREASEQVIRKREFVEKNLAEIFEKLGWRYDDKIKYSFLTCVINSNRMYVGSIINGVPVCDEKILVRYFETGQFPIITNKSMKDLAWLELYDDFGSLQKNLSDYLRYPPQVSISKDLYEYNSTILPSLNPESYKICYRRIVPKDFTPHDLIKRAHKFPIKTVENIDEELKSFSVCF